MKHVRQLLFLGCRNSPSIEDPSSIPRSKLYGLPSSTIRAEANPVSSKLLEERQAEMRQRRLQERANRKKHQFVLEPKSIGVGWDTAQQEPQVESERLERTRVASAIERHPNGSTSVSRDDLYTLVWTEAMTTVAARFGISANYLARVCDHLNVPHPNRGYWAKLSVGN